MPPVVLEPKHMSYQALHPDPEEYVPPPEVQQEWRKVNDQVSLLMACNFPTHAKQLALFNEMGTIMASVEVRLALLVAFRFRPDLSCQLDVVSARLSPRTQPFTLCDPQALSSAVSGVTTR
ncbi:hypothetical protein B0H14DRAFT_2579370 [Mycena olivaceomarginata]|nr:hypothetical protein B0H14DRAFT_2579370 [Mycena olivaceomarginata]